MSTGNKILIQNLNPADNFKIIFKHTPVNTDYYFYSPKR